MLLAGKTGVVLGVANKRSIAHACAVAASREGAASAIDMASAHCPVAARCEARISWSAAFSSTWPAAA